MRVRACVRVCARVVWVLLQSRTTTAAPAPASVCGAAEFGRDQPPHDQLDGDWISMVGERRSGTARRAGVFGVVVDGDVGVLDQVRLQRGNETKRPEFKFEFEANAERDFVTLGLS